MVATIMEDFSTIGTQKVTAGLLNLITYSFLNLEKLITEVAYSHGGLQTWEIEKLIIVKGKKIDKRVSRTCSSE